MSQENTMKMYLASASLMVVALLGTTGAQTKSDQAPSSTVVDKQQAESNDATAPGTIHLTPDTIRAAQQKLNDEGYDSGKADGQMGPVTRGAVLKYQRDKGIEETGTLDESTLSHLNVGGGKVAATAPGDIGRGTKAAGHDIKEGHPIEAGKDFGKGVGHAAKAVGEGTKSAVSEAGHKVTGEKKDEKKDESTPHQ
jgi:peptidoglycan hydrolase-like protein with peptidoglycan-binding domain